MPVPSFAINGNKCYTTGTALAPKIATQSTGAADVTISVVLGGSAGNGIAFRWTDDSNFWYAQVVSVALNLVKVQSGVPTMVDTEVISDPGGHTLTVTMSDSAIGATVGAVTASGTDNFQKTATKHGLYGVDATDSFDNFQIPTP